MSKREESSKETRNKIFQSAAKLFALRGYEAASMREIAKSADVNLALINYHFSDKSQLFNSVIEQGLLIWSELLVSLEGKSLDLILKTLMSESTSTKGTAYYMNIFMRLFLDSSSGVEFRDKLIEAGPPKVEIIQSAVAKEIGSEEIDVNSKVISHYLVNNLILSSRIRFGTTDKIRSKAYVSRLFVGEEDPYTEQLLLLARGLCSHFKKS